MSWPDWDQISEDTIQLLKQNYENNGFCFETRLNMAEFIQTNFIHAEFDIIFACNVVNQLLEQLNAYIMNMPKLPNTLTTRRILKRTLNNLQVKCSSSDDEKVQLYKIIFSSLQQELDIVSQHVKESFVEVQRKMNMLKGNVSNIVKEMHEIQQHQERQATEDHQISQYRLKFDENQQKLFEHKSKRRAKPYESSAFVEEKKKRLESMEKASTSNNTDLQTKRERLVDAFKEVCEEYNQVQDDVLDNKLIQWKCEQRKNGYGDENELKSIQKLCEDLAECILLLKQNLEQLNVESMKKEELNLYVGVLLSKLVSSTFMVAKQPPQVLRTGCRFTTEVTLLVANKIFAETLSPSLTTSILPGEEVIELTEPHVEKKSKDVKWGEINNDVQKFEMGKARFQNLQLKSIKRKSGNYCVTEDVFTLVFRTQFTCKGMNFQLWTTTLPLVVISHDSQKTQAIATVVWDNAGDKSFEAQKELPWGQVFDALSRKWSLACGGALTPDNSYYLACKAFRDDNLDLDNLNEKKLSWASFKRDTLPSSIEHKFTFWEWFHSMMVLTQQYMEPIWKEGYVIGFVNKLAAEAMLDDQPEGTFLIRFSDSTLGGVTIGSRLAESPIRKVKWLAPFTKEELNMRGIVDMIFDLKHLTSLYPNISKTYFERFRSTAGKFNDGYVSIKLKYVPDEEDTLPEIETIDIDFFLTELLKDESSLSPPSDETFQNDSISTP